MPESVQRTEVDFKPGPPRTADDRQRWAQPLRVHLSLVIVALLVTISVPLMWLTYQQGRNEALSAAEQRMTLLGQRVVDRYRGLFREGYLAVTMASAARPLAATPPSGAEAKVDFMLKALDGSPNLDGLYVGYPDGGFVQALNVETNVRWRAAISAPQETVFAVRTLVMRAGEARSTWSFLDGQRHLIGERSTADVAFDPRRRPWYRAASNKGAVVSVGPYISATTRMLTLTVASPMIGGSGAIVGADVLLETISRLLAAESVSPHSHGYVFDHQRRLIVHSDGEVMDQLLQNLTATPKSADTTEGTLDPALDAVTRLLDQGGEKQDRTVWFRVGDVPHLAKITTVDFADVAKSSTVVITAPLEDFTASSVELLRKTLWVAAGFVVAGILAALLLARVVSRALTALTADARRIGDLEFAQPRHEHSWIAEINTLAGAMASARNAIQTFALYVPRELVRRIVASGHLFEANAVRQQVTILFTDIKDFTTISERHAPEEVVSLLFEYFQIMNEIVESRNGVIVQYLGDSIYAMWNAPTADPEHVDDACRCALTLKAAIDVFNERNRMRGMPELVTRYGLHTGLAVVGSVGASTRRQYTAMGDTVNVASRLEGLNKEFSTAILVSGAVRARAGKDFDFRPLGLARAKGRTEQIEIFELARASLGSRVADIAIPSDPGPLEA